MSTYSAQSPPDFGYPNAATHLVSNVRYRKTIYDGLCSMHTDCSLQNRARAVLSMRPIIHPRDRSPSPGIPMQADKSGVQTKVIRVIQFTGNFIATLVLICQLNTWDPLHAEAENSPG